MEGAEIRRYLSSFPSRISAIQAMTFVLAMSPLIVEKIINSFDHLIYLALGNISCSY